MRRSTSQRAREPRRRDRATGDEDLCVSRGRGRPRGSRPRGSREPRQHKPRPRAHRPARHSRSLSAVMSIEWKPQQPALTYELVVFATEHVAGSVELPCPQQARPHGDRGRDLPRGCSRQYLRPVELGLAEHDVTVAPDGFVECQGGGGRGDATAGSSSSMAMSRASRADSAAVRASAEIQPPCCA